MSASARYIDALRTLPPSGGGGCHAALLSVANIGALSGVPADAVAADLRATVRGTRPVSDREIADAIRKAYDGAPAVARQWTPRTRTPQPAFDAGRMLRGILARGGGAGEVDLWEASPIRLDWQPERDAAEVLRRLYRPDDFLFIGSRHDGGRESVRTAGDWLARFAAGESIPEHIIPNPMTGGAGATKDNKPSFRADSCVAPFRFAVLEFDAVPPPLREPGTQAADWPREAQVQFWAGALAYRWPIALLLDSGGKSIHCWLAVDCADADAWTREVEGELFARFLVPCGVDSTCRNESRLSRMPGHFRGGKNRWQKILYMDPHAGKGAK